MTAREVRRRGTAKLSIASDDGKFFEVRIFPDEFDR
jgi:hypothetical protein